MSNDAILFISLRNKIKALIKNMSIRVYFVNDIPSNTSHFYILRNTRDY